MNADERRRTPIEDKLLGFVLSALIGGYAFFSAAC
jgi:hypothetical protein